MKKKACGANKKPRYQYQYTDTGGCYNSEPQLDSPMPASILQAFTIMAEYLRSLGELYYIGRSRQ